ncbi:CehA/McbA family metallohydrolase [Marinitoga arctica]
MEKKLISKKILIILAILVSTLVYSFPEDLILLFGNPHSHTAFSDGEPGTTPKDAYKYAKNVANIDFLAVTDHAYYFEAKFNGRDKFEVMKEMAMQETTNYFTAIAGFEWTAGSGHINVYNSKNWTSRNINTTTEEFYNWLISEKALAQFNHPISMFGTFKDFEYYPEVDLYINMIEVGNGSWAKNETINDEMFSNYLNALKKGWHVGATIGQDNHVANWGTGNDSRTAVWSKSRNINDILYGFKTRKTYGTEDKNAKIWIETNNSKMGDIFYYSKKPEKISLKIYYEDPDNEDIKELSIYTPLKKYTFKNLSSSFTKNIEIPIDSNYFFVFARLEQYDDESIVTSAIWYEPKDPIRIFDIPNVKLYKDTSIPYSFYVYNISKDNANADIIIYIGDNKFESNYKLKPFEKKLVNMNIKLPNKDTEKIQIKINGILWYKKAIELFEQLKISSINIDSGFLKDKYIIDDKISNDSLAIIIPSRELNNEETYNKIIEISKTKKIGIVLDEINNNVKKLIPSKYSFLNEKIYNKKLNNIFYNECWKILLNDKERGFVINKNIIIFPGNPFLNKENEGFIKRLLKLK